MRSCWKNWRHIDSRNQRIALNLVMGLNHGLKFEMYRLGMDRMAWVVKPPGMESPWVRQFGTPPMVLKFRRAHLLLMNVLNLLHMSSCLQCQSRLFRWMLGKIPQSFWKSMSRSMKLPGDVWWTKHGSLGVNLKRKCLLAKLGRFGWNGKCSLFEPHWHQ